MGQIAEDITDGVFAFWFESQVICKHYKLKKKK